MKITKVTYQKTYSIGPYLTDRVGLEADIDDKEIISDVLDNLRGKADEWHKTEHPHLYGEPVSIVSQWDANYKPPPSTLTTTSNGGPSVAVIDYKEKENLEIAIDNATSLEDLEKLKEQAGKQGLVRQYMQKLNYLSV